MKTVLGFLFTPKINNLQLATFRRRKSNCSAKMPYTAVFDVPLNQLTL